ncbi:hypothetical protein Q5752_000377 [Cryptotrichosporon argae]
MATDRSPLIPHLHSHVNRSKSHRLSVPAISFPGSREDASIDVEAGRHADLLVQRAPYETKRRPGLPKLSRECLWAEIKCYGSYILPVVLVFGVLVVGAGVLAVGLKRGWF